MSETKATEGPSSVTSTVIFDFDGTIALGNGPVVAFGTVAAELFDDPNVLAEVLGAIDAFEAGTSTARDGYAAVTSVVSAHGASPADINAAYLRSRAHLGTDRGPVDLPSGLAVFLEQLSSVADLWLATNAPAEGVARVLALGGLEESFSQTHFNVGKPDGLRPLVATALGRGPVLSVGDIYHNDLAPAAALGADTALVGRTSDRDPNVVSMRSERLEDLYPLIQTWAADVAHNSGASSESPIPQPKET